MREQSTALNDVAHLTAQRGLALGAKWHAVPGDLATGWLEHPVDHAQCRGLATARGTNDHGDLVRRNAEIEVDNRHRAIPERFAD